GDADLIFVGRSPESLFDYLSGILAGTPWEDRLTLMNVSLKVVSSSRTPPPVAGGTAAVRELLASAGLAPLTVSRRTRPAALIDFVYRGETFGRLLRLLSDWARELGMSPELYHRRLRFVGITERTKNSPNTWRWYQQVSWARRLPPRVLKSVSVPRRFWDYLADDQAKISPSYPPWRWSEPDISQPPRDAQSIAALGVALALYSTGRSQMERRAFARTMATLPAMRSKWFRSLALVVKRAVT
ncbi:MAG: hypothetical protein IH616_20140, partial [Gemmatimonadales bacterium]|nr:hypothetical protein [Gemmatimonadales bacterium]